MKETLTKNRNTLDTSLQNTTEGWSLEETLWKHASTKLCDIISIEHESTEDCRAAEVKGKGHQRQPHLKGLKCVFSWYWGKCFKGDRKTYIQKDKGTSSIHL